MLHLLIILPERQLLGEEIQSPPCLPWVQGWAGGAGAQVQGGSRGEGTWARKLIIITLSNTEAFQLITCHFAQPSKVSRPASPIRISLFPQPKESKLTVREGYQRHLHLKLDPCVWLNFQYLHYIFACWLCCKSIDLFVNQKRCRVGCPSQTCFFKKKYFHSIPMVFGG